MTTRELFTVVTPDEALRRLFARVDPRPRRTERVGLDAAHGRVLAADVVSPVDLPPFPRAMMDGYAVRASDTFGASEGNPAYLTVVGEVAMGEAPTVSIGQDQAVRIATGGMLPPGADAVVMVEYTTAIDPTLVEVVRPVAPGDNVAQVGEDLRRGEVVLTAGHRLRPWDVGCLAGIGILAVDVYARPKVAVISSGNEIVPPDVEPRGAQIRDINSYSVAAMIEQAGGVPERLGIAVDQAESLRAKLQQGLATADLVLISGGSSVGAMDLTFDVLNSLGPPGVIVHGVSIRPGKPTVIAAAGETIVFGLPGQPVSALIIFDLLVRPVLWRLAGYVPGEFVDHYVQARMGRNVRSAAGRQDHVRVTLERRDGELWAIPILGKSGSISTLVRAVGEVVIPLDQEGIEAGEIVRVRLL